MEQQKLELLINSVEDTKELAEAIAKLADAGYVIALNGDLGAGKTTFSQAFAKAIGVQEIVNSPTFTIIKEYKGDKLPFYHMDVYRLSLEEADELGLDDYFYGEGVTIVEWASLIEDILPAQYLDMYIRVVDENKRIVTLNAKGDRYIAGLEGLGKRDK